MAVSKWTWSGTNPVSDKPSISNVRFDATAEEVQRAFEAISNKGPVSDFSTKVWNDLCGKIRDMNLSWQTGNYFGNANPKAWIEYTRPTLTASAMNLAHRAIYTSAPKPWEEELGRAEFLRGDDVKGSYFLWMAEALNRWIDLIPLPTAIRNDILLEIRNRPELYLSLPIHDVLLEMFHRSTVNPALDPSLPFALRLLGYHFARSLSIAELRSKPFSSLFNFYQLEGRVGVSAENYMRILPDALGFTHDARIRPQPFLPYPFGILADHTHGGTVNAFTADDIAYVKAVLEGVHSASVLPGWGAPYGFAFSDGFHDDGTMRLRPQRAMPFAFYAPMLYGYDVQIGFQGGEYLRQRGDIPFRSDVHGIVASGKPAEQAGILTIFGNDVSVSAPLAKNLFSGEDAVILRSFGIPFSDVPSVRGGHASSFRTAQHSALALSPPIPLAQTGWFRLGLESALDTTPPLSLAHIGSFGSRGGGDLTFANEEYGTIRDYSFALWQVRTYLTEMLSSPLSVEGHETTAENIALDDAPPLSVFIDTNFTTTESGELAKDGIVEQAAEAVIRSSSFAEILTHRYDLLDADVRAAVISGLGGLTVKRNAWFESDITVYTVESALMRAVIRKLLESFIDIRTQESGRMIARHGVSAESTQFTSVFSEASAVKCRPTLPIGKDTRIRASSEAFMDLSYVRGGTLNGASCVSAEALAELSAAMIGRYVSGQAEITVEKSAYIETIHSLPAAGHGESGAVAEGEITVSYSELILASVHEDILVSDLDGVTAHGMERILIS